MRDNSSQSASIVLVLHLGLSPARCQAQVENGDCSRKHLFFFFFFLDGRSAQRIRNQGEIGHRSAEDATAGVS